MIIQTFIAVALLVCTVAMVVAAKVRIRYVFLAVCYAAFLATLVNENA